MRNTKARHRLNTDELGSLFTQYRPLAFKLAAKYSRHYGIPLDDLLIVAEGALTDRVLSWNERYDPEAGTKPLTWLYQIINFKLRDACTRKRRVPQFSNLGRDATHPVDMPARKSWMTQLRQSLGDDAKVLLGTILNAPGEIVDDIAPNAPKRSQEAVRAYLKKKGWKAERIAAAWEEVESCLA